MQNFLTLLPAFPFNPSSEDQEEGKSEKESASWPQVAKKERARELSKVCESAANFCCCCEKIVYRLILKGGEPLLCHRGRKLGTDLQIVRKRFKIQVVNHVTNPGKRSVESLEQPGHGLLISELNLKLYRLFFDSNGIEGRRSPSVRGLRSRFRCCWCSSCSRSFSAAH